MIALSKDFKLISESYYENPGVCLNFEKKKILIFRDTLTIEKKNTNISFLAALLVRVER